MSNPDDITSVVKLTVDKAAASSVVKAVKSVASELKDMGAAAANSVRRVRSEFDNAKNDIRSVDREVHTLLNTIEKLDRANVRPNISASGGRSGAELTDRAGSALSQIAGGLGSGELANAAGLVADLAGSVDDLGLKSTLALGAVGLLGAGLTALVTVAQKLIEEAQREYDARVDVIKAIQDQTSLEANRAQAEAAIQRENAELALEYLERQKDIQVEIANGAGFDLQAYVDAQIKIDALNNLIREQETIVEEANATIGIYNQLLAEGATKANDTAAASAEAIAMIERAQGVIAEGEARLAEIRLEGIERFVDRATDLWEQISSGFVSTVSQIPNDLAQYEELAANAADAQAEYNATLAEGQTTVSRLAAESQERQNAILAEGNQEARDLAEEYNYDTVEAERQLQRELAQIRRSADIEQANAIGDRQALEHYLSEQAEETELDQAEEAAEDQERQRKRAYDIAMRNLARSIDDRLRAEQAALQRSLQMEEERWRRELQTRQTALTAAQQQLEAFAISTDNIMHTIADAAVTGLATVQTATTSFVDGLLADVARLAQAEVGGQTVEGGGSGSYTPSANAAGGDVRAGEWSWVGEEGPELVRFGRSGRVFSNPQSRQMAGGGININVNGGGRMSDSEIRRVVNQVDRDLTAALRRQRAAA